MAGDLRGVYLIGDKLNKDKRVTAVVVQNLASGELSTLSLQEYVNRGIEPADGTLPWQEDITPKNAPGVSDFQPDPSQWGTSNWDDAAVRRTASTNRGPAITNTEVLPPPLQATLETAPMRPDTTANTQPHELRAGTGEFKLEGRPADATLAGAGGLAANAEVVSAKRKAVVIRSKAQVIREAGLLIIVLENALHYHPDPHRNSPPPELWHQLNLEDPAAFQLISELVTELKRLNEFLRTQGRATSQSKVVLDLQKAGLAVLKTYGKTVAVGAGLLTIGALCTLLQHVGAGDVVENAMLWKKIGH